MDDIAFWSVGGIVLRGDDVLLARHTYGSVKGLLLNPSGYSKAGEMPEDTLRREILEETGVEISVRGLLGIRCSGKNWWMVFLADYAGGEPQSDGVENSEVVFLPREQALMRGDVTDSTKALIRLSMDAQLFHVDEGYAAVSDKNRVLYAGRA